MDTLSNSGCYRHRKSTEAVLLQTPEPDTNNTTGENNESNPVSEVIRCQDEKPPDAQSTETSYRAMFTIRYVALLDYIIGGNCLCSGFLCLTLWDFSKWKTWPHGRNGALMLYYCCCLGFLGLVLGAYCIGLVYRYVGQFFNVNLTL